MIKWTPIEDGFPKEDGEYLCTVNYSFYASENYITMLYFVKHNDDEYSEMERKNDVFYDSDSEWGDIDYTERVIAWCKVEPYNPTK